MNHVQTASARVILALAAAAIRVGDDARETRKEILDVSGNVGLLPATYARG